MKTIHEVEKNGNLYFLLSAGIGAINRLSDSLGHGLMAIALAMSTTEDNSAEIKALTDKLKQSTDQLETAVDEANKGE